MLTLFIRYKVEFAVAFFCAFIVASVALAAEAVGAVGAAISPSAWDSILALLSRPETFTVIATIIAAVVPVIGLPAWATAIITGAAGVAVPYIEQTSKEGASSEEKKAAGVKAVKEMVPLILRVLPGTAKKIDAAIEAKVYDLTL